MALPQVLLIAAIVACTLADDDARVTLEQGAVKGRKFVFLGNTVQVYLGIPYAEPPVGSLRFQKPRPAQPWTGTLDATNPKSSCIQEGTPVLGPIADTSEDCLFLNVWAPAKQGPLKSVMVWIHGGAFNFGSSYQDWYNGSALVSSEDVVVVTLNYRLGPFGFLTARTAEAPGNVGLYDQALALQWVQANIEAFGGNRDKVTLFGESAGSMSIHAHMISPLTTGLFHRGIMMSGNLYTPGVALGVDEMLRRGNNFARHVSCATFSKDLSTQPDDVLKCLRSKSAEELQAGYETFEQRFIKKFMPIFNEEFLPVVPCLAMSRGLFKKVDIMSGLTEDEGTIMFVSQPDKRIVEDNLQHISEEELEASTRSLMQSWLNEFNDARWEFYQNKVDPSEWKTGYRKASSDFVTDELFKCPHKVLSDRLSGAESTMFSYLFGHCSEMSPYPKWAGVPHTTDIFYFFGLPMVYPDHYTDDDRAFCKDVMKMAATFAKEGAPVLPTGEKWPKYTVEDPVSISMKAGNFTTLRGMDLKICDHWQESTC
ncbi:acetylcholinesterase-like [Ornithodoros turicata]|uniref:acetylcholinesterase-like n=1 Tax=Ornithodoros turicata TaxID=34597 RepID=UPI00313A3CB5